MALPPIGITGPPAGPDPLAPDQPLTLEAQLGLGPGDQYTRTTPPD